MKKITIQFTKYTIILLIVGAILVLVGGLSVARTAVSNQREIALDMSARTRVDVISKENAELKNVNAQLKKDIELALSEKEIAERKAKTLEAFLLMGKYIEEENFEKANEQVKLVDEALLPEELKEEYSKNIELIKE